MARITHFEAKEYVIESYRLFAMTIQEAGTELHKRVVDNLSYLSKDEENAYRSILHNCDTYCREILLSIENLIERTDTFDPGSDLYPDPHNEIKTEPGTSTNIPTANELVGSVDASKGLEELKTHVMEAFSVVSDTNGTGTQTIGISDNSRTIDLPECDYLSDNPVNVDFIVSEYSSESQNTDPLNYNKVTISSSSNTKTQNSNASRKLAKSKPKAKQVLKHKEMLKCTECDMTFPSKDILREHAFCAHGGKTRQRKEGGKIWKCQTCDVIFPNRDFLRNHARMLHKAGESGGSKYSAILHKSNSDGVNSVNATNSLHPNTIADCTLDGKPRKKKTIPNGKQYETVPNCDNSKSGAHADDDFREQPQHICEVENDESSTNSEKFSLAGSETDALQFFTQAQYYDDLELPQSQTSESQNSENVLSGSITANTIKIDDFLDLQCSEETPVQQKGGVIYKEVLKCSDCDMVFLSKDILREHTFCEHGRNMRRTQAKKKYSCQKCDIIFPNRDFLRNHTRTLHGAGSKITKCVSGQYSNVAQDCTLDGKPVRKKGRRTDNIWKCDICDIIFQSRDQLRDHASQLHPKRKPKRNTTPKGRKRAKRSQEEQDVADTQKPQTVLSTSEFESSKISDLLNIQQVKPVEDVGIGASEQSNVKKEICEISNPSAELQRTLKRTSQDTESTRVPSAAEEMPPEPNTSDTHVPKLSAPQNMSNRAVTGLAGEMTPGPKTSDTPEPKLAKQHDMIDHSNETDTPQSPVPLTPQVLDSSETGETDNTDNLRPGMHHPIPDLIDGNDPTQILNPVPKTPKVPDNTQDADIKDTTERLNPKMPESIQSCDTTSIDSQAKDNSDSLKPTMPESGPHCDKNALGTQDVDNTGNIKSEMPESVQNCDAATSDRPDTELNPNASGKSEPSKHTSVTLGGAMKKKRGPNSSKIWKCEDCDFVPRGRDDYRAHIKEVHGDRRLRKRKKKEKPPTSICHHCGNVFKTSALPRHVLTHTKLHKCKTCGKRFAEKHMLLTHELFHTGVKPFKCDLCDMGFYKRHKLKTHVAVEHHAMRYNCDQCGFGFRQKSHLDHHVIRAHSDYRPHSCGVCGKGFVSKTEIKNHMATHSNQYDFKCPECDAKFCTEKSYNRHVRITHSTEKHICHICAKVFKHHTELNHHIRGVHNDAKKCTCDICGQEFKWPHSLKEHMTRHAGEPKYQCKVCKRKFFCSGNFAKHKRIHPQ